MRPELKQHIICLGLFVTCLLCPALACSMETSDCFDCHSDADMVGEDFTLEMAPFINSAHADVGCTSCHESITDEHPDDGLAASKASCLDCHDDIGEEYSQTAHGDNVTCSDCHNPHMVRGTTAVSGHDMNQTCSNCHEPDEVATSHSDWLPQAGLHISMLPCISCHTASEDLVISMYIIKNKSDATDGGLDLASHEELKALVGGDNVQALVDTNNDDYISLTELRMFNRNPANKTVRLLGMMTPERVTHSIEILENRWDCTFCHASGPEAMQTSFLCLAQSDGSFKRVPAEKGAVLDALFGTPDFYMVGATRSKAMNYVGLAIIAGGLVLPVGHGSLRFLTRKNRRKSEDES